MKYALFCMFNTLLLAVSFSSTAFSESIPRTDIQPVLPTDGLPRRLPPCGPQFMAIPGNEKSLCGSSESTDGVVGTSVTGNGVLGTGASTGVLGKVNNGIGYGVRAQNLHQSGTALSAEVKSELFPAAIFTNTHPTGPHIFAGPRDQPVFEVKHDGRVFVKGREIGLKGDRGEKGSRGDRGERGLTGPAGPAGSVVRSSVAVCGYTVQCGCTSSTTVVAVTAAPLGGACSAVADNGKCDHNDTVAQKGPGMCCVCVPR